MTSHRRFPYLLSELAAVCLLGSVAQAKTDLIQPFRELQIDPATLMVDGKTYRQADVVVRALLRRPATIRAEEDRTIDLHGFSVTVPKGTVLTASPGSASIAPRSATACRPRSTAK